MSKEPEFQKCSSAVTLSDMEIFIFPELMYGLVLANIMSERIWKWREDPWFDGIERMSPYRRITRLKQYIMDHYTFNLDLDTWGLTTRETELARFSDVISEDILAKSNALFGYEGDSYYFDIDIRTHFGLDKYNSNIIPYWKTETVEAMDAFCHKPGYNKGAGECVSLAALYAAALFVVARIPLKDMFLMATPLHSQNFVMLDDGIIINNRRLVTKNMWFNGTALSAQARRALENEQVTIVAHESGVVHSIYEDASIDKGDYDHFSDSLKEYLRTDLTPEILGNFLRQNKPIQMCFAFKWTMHGRDYYMPMDRIYAYEHGSPYRLTDRTRDRLIDSIDHEEFTLSPCPNAIIYNDVEDFVRDKPVSLDSSDDMDLLKEQFNSRCVDSGRVIDELSTFCHVKPRLPGDGKNFVGRKGLPLGIDVEMTREEICERLSSIREHNSFARYAFYSFRDLSSVDSAPFIEACLHRNPVSRLGSEGMSETALLSHLNSLGTASIYDEPGRLAQPDEVWNFGMGDGLEKALTAANILRSRDPGGDFCIEIADGEARLLKGGEPVAVYLTEKKVRESTWNLTIED